MKNEQIALRDYNPSTDYPGVRSLLEECEMYDRWWDSKERLDKRSAERPDTLIVAENFDQIVGNVFLIDDFYPFIFRLAVTKDFRRMGIGKMLVEESMRRVRLHGHKSLGLYMNDNNEKLRGWYRKLGFNSGPNQLRLMWRDI